MNEPRRARKRGANDGTQSPVPFDRTDSAHLEAADLVASIDLPLIGGIKGAIEKLRERHGVEITDRDAFRYILVPAAKHVGDCPLDKTGTTREQWEDEDVRKALALAAMMHITQETSAAVKLFDMRRRTHRRATEDVVGDTDVLVDFVSVAIDRTRHLLFLAMYPDDECWEVQ